MKSIMQNWRSFITEERLPGGLPEPTPESDPEAYKDDWPQALTNLDEEFPNTVSRKSLITNVVDFWSSPSNLKKLIHSPHLGVPSSYDIIRAYSEDKEILTTLKVMLNPEHGMMVFKDKSKSHRSAIASAGRDFSGWRKAKRNWLTKLLRFAPELQRKRITFYLTTAARSHVKELRHIFYSFSRLLPIAVEPRAHFRREIKSGERPDYKPELDDRIEQALADKFLKFCGFMVSCSLSCTVVHELAHQFDMYNSWNWSTEEFYGTGLHAIETEEEIYATNKEKLYLIHLEKSGLGSQLGTFGPRNMKIDIYDFKPDQWMDPNLPHQATIDWVNELFGDWIQKELNRATWYSQSEFSKLHTVSGPDSKENWKPTSSERQRDLQRTPNILARKKELKKEFEKGKYQGKVSLGAALRGEGPFRARPYTPEQIRQMYDDGDFDHLRIDKQSK